MKVAILSIQYTIKNFGWGRRPIPSELRSKFRFPFFQELIKQVQHHNVGLVVFPGGFFRSDYPHNIASFLENNPPKVNVLFGRDNERGNICEVWVIAPNGKVSRKIPEAWIYKSFKRQAVLNRIKDRRFQIYNKFYSAYSCGDVMIDHRKSTDSKASFVLAHYSAKGRSFTPSMRKLAIPTFLSHHVKDPENTISFAYNGKYEKNMPKPIVEPIKGKFQGLKWIARVYCV